MTTEATTTPTAITTATTGSDFLVNVTNIIYKLESTLYSLYQIFAAPVYSQLTSMLPAPIKTVLTKVGDTLNGIVTQLRDALNSKYMETGVAILETTEQLLASTEGFVPETIAAATDKVRKFMQLIVGLAKLGKAHIDAVLDLFDAVVNRAIGNTSNQTAYNLETATTSTIEPALAMFPIPDSVQKLVAAKDVTALASSSTTTV